MEHFGYYASALLYRFSGRELSHANRLDTRRNFLNILRKRQPYWAVFNDYIQFFLRLDVLYCKVLRGDDDLSWNDSSYGYIRFSFVATTPL